MSDSFWFVCRRDRNVHPRQAVSSLLLYFLKNYKAREGRLKHQQCRIWLCNRNELIGYYICKKSEPTARWQFVWQRRSHSQCLGSTSGNVSWFECEFTSPSPTTLQVFVDSWDHVKLISNTNPFGPSMCQKHMVHGMNTTHNHNPLFCKSTCWNFAPQKKAFNVYLVFVFFSEVKKQTETIHWRGTAKGCHSNRFDWSMDAWSRDFSTTILDATDVTIVPMLSFLEFEAKSHCEVSVWTNLNVEVKRFLGPKDGHWLQSTWKVQEGTVREYQDIVSWYPWSLVVSSKCHRMDDWNQVFDTHRPPVLSMWELNMRMYICGMISYVIVIHSQ